MTATGTGLAPAAARLVECLTAARERMPDLPFLGIHSVRTGPGDIDDALAGTFRHREERFELSPPVDWWEEPYTGAHERGFFQNSFIFADPLLLDPRFPEVLPQLAAIFADWLAANPRTGAAHPHRYAWHDHAAAGRIVSMSFVLREGIRRGAIEARLAEGLAAGVLEHARYLIAEENYAGHNNHGFASDAALALAARNLALAPQAEEWAAVAERRMERVLARTIEGEEALHLEHSPAYHWNIHAAIARLAAVDLFDRLDLAGLSRRMEASGVWLTAPGGGLPPLGDTSAGQKAPPWAASVAPDGAEMKVFPRTGYAVVRSGDSALFVTAAHHPTAHKHADDGSFCLYEGGRAVVLDSGCPGYEYESAEFAYGTSPAAHATIYVDGFDWAKNAPAYGSGIVASAERDGMHAVLTRNPNAVPGGGAARRVLVYAPGRFLLVVDDVEADGAHRLERHLPLAPGLEARATARGDVEILAGGSALGRIVQVRTPGAPPDEVEIAHGRRSPELRGFCFVSPGDPAPSCDVTLSGTAGGPRAYALTFGTGADVARPIEMTRGETGGIDFTVKGIAGSPLRVRADEGSLTIGD